MLLVFRAVWTALTVADLSAVFILLGARPPRTDDGEERQLINVVEEISIAAVLPPPRLLLLDNESINVAVLGTSPQTATLVVTRGLLDRCNRDETQALIADAIASIGNGDLRATLRWIAVSVTITVVRRLLQAPYWKPAREHLASLRRLLWRKESCDPTTEAAALAELLRDQSAEPGDLTGGRVKLALTFPFFMAHALFNAVGWFASLLFLSPALSFLFRRRRYLADAIAVQLTRYPDALASALNRVIVQPRQEPTIPSLLTLLFVAAPPNKFSDHERPVGFFFGTHASLGKRHERVTRMGLLARREDTSEFARLSALPVRHRWLVGGLLALLVPLIGATIYLMLYLIVVLTGFSLVVGMIYVLAVIMPLRWMLRM
jgi:heat shock protein HtpX